MNYPQAVYFQKNVHETFKSFSDVVHFKSLPFMVSRRNSLKCLHLFISCDGLTMKTLPFLLSMENNILLGFDIIGRFSKVSNVHFSREILAWFRPLRV